MPLSAIIFHNEQWNQILLFPQCIIDPSSDCREEKEIKKPDTPVYRKFIITKRTSVQGTHFCLSAPEDKSFQLYHCDQSRRFRTIAVRQIPKATRVWGLLFCIFCNSKCNSPLIFFYLISSSELKGDVIQLSFLFIVSLSGNVRRWICRELTRCDVRIQSI